MWFLKIFRILFPKKEEVKSEVKELSAEEIAIQQDRERRCAEFKANQPEEIPYGKDMFGNQIMMKKQKTPDGITFYSAPVKILDFQQRAWLHHIIRNQRTPEGEYIV